MATEHKDDFVTLFEADGEIGTAKADETVKVSIFQIVSPSGEVKMAPRIQARVNWNGRGTKMGLMFNDADDVLALAEMLQEAAVAFKKLKVAVAPVRQLRKPSAAAAGIVRRASAKHPTMKAS